MTEEVFEGLEKIEVSAITFEMYGERWSGFIRDDVELLSGEDITDDDWEFLPEFSDCVYVSFDDGSHCGEAVCVRESSIMIEVFKDSRLHSGWGGVRPASGHGLNDEAAPDFYAEIDAEIVYLRR